VPEVDKVPRSLGGAIGLKVVNVSIDGKPVYPRFRTHWIKIYSEADGNSRTPQCDLRPTCLSVALPPTFSLVSLPNAGVCGKLPPL